MLKFKGTPLKTNISPETNGWFRCIPYWNSPFFRGHSLVFGGYFLADASPPLWKANSSTKRSTTSKVSNLRNFRSTNVFKCLGEMQDVFGATIGSPGDREVMIRYITPSYTLQFGGWEISGSRWGLTFSFTDVFEWANIGVEKKPVIASLGGSIAVFFQESFQIIKCRYEPYYPPGWMRTGIDSLLPSEVSKWSTLQKKNHICIFFFRSWGEDGWHLAADLVAFQMGGSREALLMVENIPCIFWMRWFL